VDKKTKYMKLNTNSSNSGYDFVIDGEVFEGEQNFRYQWNFIDSKNEIIEEIKSKNAAGNRFCYSLSQVYRSRYQELLMKQLQSKHIKPR
jgi:hypothetical protein